MMKVVEEIIRASDASIVKEEASGTSDAGIDPLIKLVGLVGKMICKQTRLHLKLKTELYDLTVMPKVQAELMKVHEEKMKKLNSDLLEE